MATWQIQQAKAHLSDVIEQAQTQGPQIITRHGTQRAVVLSINEYEQLNGKKKSLIEHLLSGPKFDDFKIERDRGPYRTVNFGEDE